MVTDEDALFCDLAETYGIYDLEALPLFKIATLAIGLKGDSRIMRKMTGFPVGTDTFLLAGILDRLSFLAWTKTKDAQSGRNRPDSILNNLMHRDTKPERNFEVFASGEEFMERLKQLRGG